MSSALGSTRVRIMASRSSAVVVRGSPDAIGGRHGRGHARRPFEGADGTGPEAGPQGVGRAVQAVLDHRDGQALLLGRQRAAGGLGLRQQGGQDVDLQRAGRVLDHARPELVDLTGGEVLDRHGHVVGPTGDIGGDRRDHLRPRDRRRRRSSSRPADRRCRPPALASASPRRIPRTVRPRRRRRRRRPPPASSPARRGAAMPDHRLVEGRAAHASPRTGRPRRRRCRRRRPPASSRAPVGVAAMPTTGCVEVACHPWSP